MSGRGASEREAPPFQASHQSPASSGLFSFLSFHLFWIPHLLLKLESLSQQLPFGDWLKFWSICGFSVRQLPFSKAALGSCIALEGKNSLKSIGEPVPVLGWILDLGSGPQGWHCRAAVQFLPPFPGSKGCSCPRSGVPLIGRRSLCLWTFSAGKGINSVNVQACSF